VVSSAASPAVPRVEYLTYIEQRHRRRGSTSTSARAAFRPRRVVDQKVGIAGFGARPWTSNLYGYDADGNALFKKIAVSAGVVVTTGELYHPQRRTTRGPTTAGTNWTGIPAAGTALPTKAADGRFPEPHGG